MPHDGSPCFHGFRQFFHGTFPVEFGGQTSSVWFLDWFSRLAEHAWANADWTGKSIKSNRDRISKLFKIKVGLGMPSWTRLLICAQNCSDLMSPKEISFQDSPPFTMRAPSCDLTRWYSPRNPRKDSIPGSNWMTLQPRTGSGNAQSRDLKKGCAFFSGFFLGWYFLLFFVLASFSLCFYLVNEKMKAPQRSARLPRDHLERSRCHHHCCLGR